MTISKRVPEHIIYAYVAFLKNQEKVVKAMEAYYSDPTSVGRARLVQEIARVQKGPLSERVMKGNVVVEKILDTYNSIQPIEHEDIEIDIDFDGEIEKLVFKGGNALISNLGSFKRIK